MAAHRRTFPPLYDDGPIDQGGHEPVGSKKGDHIFGTVVFVKPAADRDIEFEYGVINEDDNWLWEGANGKIVVKKGSTDVLRAQGLKIPRHGSIDIKIALDTNKMPNEFKLTDPATPIFLKGTMSDWAPIQILDKGTDGDDTKGDGVHTYVQSKVLDYSPHYGKLAFERAVQFVFQFNSATGREYKDIDDRAVKDGVTVWADCNGDGTFSEDEKQELIYQKDSRGAVDNTAIIVCKGKEPPCTPNDCAEARCKDKPVCQGVCTDSAACPGDQVCANGACRDCTPNDCKETKCKTKPVCQTAGCSGDSACQTGEVCEANACRPCNANDCANERCKNQQVCQATGCKQDSECQNGKKCNTTKGACQDCLQDKDCPDSQICDTTAGTCNRKPCTPADCTLPRCQNDPVCTNPNTAPVIYLLQPSAGPLAGGSEITIDGDRFLTGVKVTFGGVAATDIKLVSAQRITCKTPASPTAGLVDVTVTNTDNQSNTFPKGFNYDNNAVNPNQFSLKSVVPDTSLPVGGSKVKLIGGGFASGMTVKFGNNNATTVKVLSKTEAEVTVPAGTIGRVDVAASNSGQSATLAQGFTYTGFSETVGWCIIQWPKGIPDSSVTPAIPAAVAGNPSPTIYGRVWKQNVTGPGKGGVGIVGQVGHGPKGSDPTTDNNWVWTNARHNPGYTPKPGDNEDEYQGSLTIEKAGTYNYAYRFSSDGGLNFWYCDIDGNTTQPRVPYRTSKSADITDRKSVV